MTCPSAAKKSCGSHLFGFGPGEADKTALVQELSKAITFCLRFYPCEISHSNSAKRELSNGVMRLEVLMVLCVWKFSQEKLHFTPVHTLCQLKCDEALFPPLRRVVEFRARYG